MGLEQFAAFDLFIGNGSDLQELVVFLQPQLVCPYFLHTPVYTIRTTMDVSCTNWSWRNKGIIIIPAVRVWIWHQRNIECHPSLTAACVSHPLPTPICCQARQSPGPHSHYRWVDRSAVPLPSGAIKVGVRHSGEIRRPRRIEHPPAREEHRRPARHLTPWLVSRGIPKWYCQVVLNAPWPRRHDRRVVVQILFCSRSIGHQGLVRFHCHWHVNPKCQWRLVVSASQRPTTKTTDSFEGTAP